MSKKDDDEIDEIPEPILFASRSADSSFSTTAAQRQEIPPLYLRPEEGPEHRNGSENHRQHHVSFAPDAGNEASPDLHTLLGHNMLAETSGTKTMANATKIVAINDKNKHIPGYRHAQR